MDNVLRIIDLFLKINSLVINELLIVFFYFHHFISIIIPK